MMLSFQFCGRSQTEVNHAEVVNWDDIVGAEHHQLVVENVEKEDLGLDHHHLSEVVVKFFGPRVQPDLVPEGCQVVASHDHVLSPPEEATGHYEVFFLGLVSKKTPPPVK